MRLTVCLHFWVEKTDAMSDELHIECQIDMTSFQNSKDFLFIFIFISFPQGFQTGKIGKNRKWDSKWQNAKKGVDR